ncbi:hypothetical protein [Microbacterium maritypicum]|uniref:hypothetical protein n=1 Tax=Microbacterium maritypicum TaxID=33918 RepID=UPI0022DEDB41|nr:hypothetical protein [Microbacterium liquefaciens]
MTALVDPHVLVETDFHTLDEDFWKRIVAIAKAKHLQIGHEAFHWVVAQLTALGYPAERVDFGPANFSRECQSAMEGILSRVSKGEATPEDVTVDPTYLGSEEAELALIIDITSHGAMVNALMSDRLHWDGAGASLRFGDVEIELLTDPAKEPSALDREEVRAYFSARRINILGGSATRTTLAALEDELGITEEQVRWVESEISRPPRSWDKAWGQLQPDRDVAICNTGRVSHSVWEKGDKAAAGCGVSMLECDSQGQIVPTLQRWARSEIAKKKRADETAAAAG